jgi:hypothetical protein
MARGVASSVAAALANTLLAGRLLDRSHTASTIRGMPKRSTTTLWHCFAWRSQRSSRLTLKLALLLDGAEGARNICKMGTTSLVCPGGDTI